MLFWEFILFAYLMFLSQFSIDYFIIYCSHVTLDNDKRVSSNIHINFDLNYNVLWKVYGHFLLVLTKAM